MKKVLKKFNRTLSIMLAAAMVLTMVPQTAMPVLAAEEAIADTDVTPEDVGETVEAPESEQNEEVTAPSDEGNPDIEGDDIANEEPTEEDPATEEPSEEEVNEVESPADEAEVEYTLMNDEISLQDGEAKLYPSIKNEENAKWTLTAVTGLEAGTYFTVGTIGEGDAAYEGFVNATDSGIATSDLAGKKLAFNVNVKEGYQFKSTDQDEQVKATLLDDDKKAIDGGEIAATYVSGHYEIDLGDITADMLGSNQWPSLVVWADVVKTYTVNLPVEATDHATVIITSGAPGNKATELADIVFTAAASTGYVLKAVKYTVGDGAAESLTADEDGNYTIPKDKITDDITISVETAEKITISFADYTDTATNRYTIYPVTKTADGKYETADSASEGTLDAVEGEDAYFQLRADELFNIKSVSAVDTNGKSVYVSRDGSYYRLRSDSDATVTVSLALNTTAAFKATFEIAEGSDPYFSVTTDGSELDTIVKEHNVYTGKVERIHITLTPEEGYEITKIEEWGAGPEEGYVEITPTENTATGAKTVEPVFAQNSKLINYRVTVSAKALADDGGKVTFTMAETVKDLDLEVVTAEGKVEKTDDAGEIYQIKKDAQYLEFTLTTDNTKIEPVVKVGSKTWGSTTEKSPFTYKVSASLLTTDTTIAIDQKTAENELKIVADGNHINLQGITVKGGDTSYKGTEYADEDESGMLYNIPVDTELVLTIPAKQSCVIKSYKINGGTAKSVNASSAEISVTLAADTTISIDSLSQQTPVLEMAGDDGNVAVEKGKDGYAVNYNSKYVAYILDGAEGKLILEKATLKVGKDLAAVQPVLKDDAAEFTVAATDAGKKLTLELYSSAATNAQPVATYVLNVNKAITKVTVPGVKNKKLAQPVDTEVEYVVTADPKGMDTANLDVDVKWADDAKETDKAAFTATMEAGKLTITTATAKDAEAAAALKASAEKATIRFADKTKGTKNNGSYPDAAIVDGSEFTLVIEEPAALTKATPTVVQKSSDDVSFTLTLGVPASAKVVAPAEGKLWYEVTVTPQGESVPADLKPATTYYVAKTEEATQEKKIDVFTDKEFGQGYAYKFDVTAKLVQTVNDYDLTDTEAENYETDKAAALTAFASKDSKKLTAATKDPYYETKLSLKKGTTTVYTGQEVKIATPQFGKNTTYTDITEVNVRDLTDDTGKVSFRVDNGDIYMSVEPGGCVLDEEDDPSGYVSTPLGKHTIEVMALAPAESYAAKATLVVNVVRGIEKISLSAPSTIYKADKKAATLKLAPTFNWEDTDKNMVPKTKKVTYDIVEPLGVSNSNLAALKAAVTAKANGTVTVAKDYNVLTDPASNTFRVKVTAADFYGNTVEDYTDNITITSTGMELGEICIARQSWRDPDDDDDDDDYVGSEYEVISRGKTSFTSGELEYDDYYLIVLKKEVGEKAVYRNDDIIAPEDLTFKSSNNALTIYPSGIIYSVNKTANNVKLTATANDGSKNSVDMTINIVYDEPAQLGLRVERQDDFDTYNYYPVGDDNSSEFTFNGTSDTVLKLTVVQRDDDDSDWEEVNQITNFKLAPSGFKVLNKNSRFNQTQLVIANKATATVKLTIGKETKTYTITNTGFSTAKTPTVKGSGNLIAGSYGAQEITYTLQGNYDYKGKVVMVKSDATDRNNVKNTARYEDLEAQSNINGWIAIDDNGKFTLHFGDEVEGSNITAGSYKLNLTFGTLAADGSMVPDTKSMTVTLKAAAPKALKSSYKPVSTVKMSVYDTAAGVTLAGTGKNIDAESETYKNLLNANITGQANHFRDLFELDESTNVLKLKSEFSSELKAALKKAEEITEETDAAVLTYITTSKTKAAKNDRIGYVTYSATGLDGKTYGDTTKLTVTFDNKKSTDTYTLTNTTILEGTETAAVQVLKNKKAGAVITDAYVVSSDKDGNFTATESGGDQITLTLDKATMDAPNKYKVTVAVVPANNYYAAEIARLKAAWDAAKEDENSNATAVKGAEDAYVNSITTNGVQLTTTITVGEKGKIGNKISVAKNLLKQTFTGYDDERDGAKSGYFGPDQNYWIKVPYTKNMECEIASIDSGDTAYVKAEGEDTERKNLISFNAESEGGTEYINISLNKEDLKRAVAEKKVKYNNKGIATLTVTATIHFGTWVPAAEEGGEGHWDVVDANGKDIIKSETVKFTLTLPKQPTADSNYAKAVEAVQANTADIAKAAVPADWLWKGEGLPLPTADNGIITLTSEANEELIYRLNDLVYNVRDEITEIAPEDYDVMIVMPQECVDKDGVDTMTLSDGDFIAPTTSTKGTFKVKAILYDATMLDENGNVIPEDTESATPTEKTEIVITLTIPELKETPADITTALQAWINKQKADSDYIKYLRDDGGVQLAKDARVALGITDANGNPLNTLRLNVEDWKYEGASEEGTGSITGTIKVFGYRYGGAEVKESFDFEIPELENLAGTVSLVDTAVKGLTATNATVKADILKAANDAIRNPQFKAVWQKAGDGTLTDSQDENKAVEDENGDVYKIVKADRTKAGYVIGTIVVENSESDAATGNTVNVNLAITKLPAVADAIASVKTAVATGENDEPDNLLKLIEIGENTSAKVKAAILEAANDAVKDDGFTVAYKKDGRNDLFSFTAAKYDTKGSISFTLELTDTLAETPTVVTETVAIDSYEFGPFEGLQTLDQAKNDLTAAVTNKTLMENVTNDTDANAVKTAAEAVVTGDSLTVSVTDFEKTEATVKAAGSITCKITITNTAATKANTATITFTAEIAKLSQTLTEARTAAQGVLDGMDALTNDAIETTGEGDDAVDSVKADVLSDVKTAVEAVVDTDAFTVDIDDAEGAVTAKKASTTEAGEIKITVKITDEKDTTVEPVTASRTWEIDKLEETPEG